MIVVTVEHITEKAKELATALNAAQQLPEDDRRPAIRQAIAAAGELWNLLRRWERPSTEGEQK